MKFLKRKLLFLDIFFFLGIYFASIRTLRDFDVWFHLKSGEIFSKMGIIHHDVFSYTAKGRELFPYEWLFQIGLYQWSELFGLTAIPYLISAIVIIMIGSLFMILRYVIGLSRLWSYALCFFFLTSVFEFLTARPHVPAYTFYIIFILLILLYFQKNKNFLWISLPFTLMWANIHGSIFLGVALFVSYAGLAIINYFLHKDKGWLHKAKILGIYAAITTVLSILPPLGTTQYRLLFYFYQKGDLITKFIEEWTPLSFSLFPFIFYTTTAIFVLILFLFAAWKKRNLKEMIWLIPIIPFPFLAYIAARNVFLGYVSFVIIIGWSLKKLQDARIDKKIRIFGWVFFATLVFFHAFVLIDKHRPDRLYYPVKAVNFMKTYKINGNMFNEYGYGGFLLYNLYPEYKVFFDGRTDIYLCCEMPETLDLAFNKHKSDKEYKKLLDKFWDKHDISFVLFRTEKHSVLRKIGRILSNDPNWSIVFWDDDTMLFVRKDGKNDPLLDKFAAFAATPYDQDPYRKGKEKEAFEEYQKMIEVADSAKSRNALGYIYLQNEEFEKAQEEFERALQIDTSNESPYMNLAELAAYSGNAKEAIRLYEEALKRAPDRGLIYIRLGQLYLEAAADENEARKIWEQGLKKTVDEDARNKLKKLLQTL